MKGRILAFLELMRPINGLIGGVAFGLGMWIGGIALPAERLLLSLGVILLAYGFSNVDNDVMDHAVDRRVHPRRPLPSGRVDLQTARRFSHLLAVGSLLLALPLGGGPFLFVATMLLWTWVYNRWGKGWPFLGNLMVAVAASGVFPFLVLLSGEMNRKLLWVTLFAVLFHLVREMVKDCADVTGDGEAGYRTLPVVRGVPFTLWTARLLQGLLLVLTVFAGRLGAFPGPGYWAFTVGVYGAGGLLLLLLTRPSSPSCARTARGLKALLLPAFLGLLAGSAQDGAGNAFARRACRLGPVIVGPLMDHHRPGFGKVFLGEPGDEELQGKGVVHHVDVGKVPCMEALGVEPSVFCAAGIVMSTGRFEVRRRALALFVDMEGVGSPGQTACFQGQDDSLGCGGEFHMANGLAFRVHQQA